MISLPSVLPTTLVTLVTAIMALCAVQNDDVYVVRKSRADPGALMAADTAAWAEAAQIDWGTEPWPTSFRALSTADALWLRFDAVDSSPWYTYTDRDDKLWEEEVVEIFIDPDGDHLNYVEVEVNPANALCDLLVEQGDPNLRALIEWDFPGIGSTVLPTYDEEGAQTGWSAMVRMPWTGFRSVPATDVSLPPASGDQWHFNVFRIKRPDGPDSPNRNVVLDAWSPTPGQSFHVPEVFRTMEFE
jgi:hypothetical protein